MKKRVNKVIFFVCAIFLCWIGMPCQSFGQEQSLTVEVHYTRYNEDYEGWNLWLWVDENEGRSFEFETDGSEVKTEVELSQVSGDSRIGILLRKGDWEEKDVDGDRYLDLTKAKEGRLTIWLMQGEETVYYSQEKTGVRILDACLDSETEITFRAYCAGTESLSVVDQQGKEYALAHQELSKDGNIVSGKLTLKEAAALPGTFYLVIGDVKESIRFGGIYDTDAFKDNFVYEGEDLGVICQKERSSFCLWSPMAEEVTLKLYEEGTGGSPVKSIPLARGEKGVWRLTLEGDYRNQYYTYVVNVQGEEWEVSDPYARSTGLNGERGMLLAHDEGVPEGFLEDTFLTNTAREDVILYEMSVRDFTFDEVSGVQEKGKFLGLTEKGTVNPSGDSTGLSYLAELGITHVHLLPVQDFGGVDEENPEEAYNWGYGPVSFFVPEGSYSTDPYHGEVRVEECKRMVQSLHSKQIGVVMDVVYNHTYQNTDSNLNRIVPGYYYRMKEDGSFSDGSRCGNELATEREMVRKLIMDSLKYWMEEYHIDGFRFDLMGLIDVETMKEIEEMVYSINPHAVLYGEGWDAGETVYEGVRMESANAWMTPQIGTFNNVFRRAVQKYICGMTEEESTVLGMRFGFAGAVSYPDIYDRMGSWTDNPLQCINYASCHDGYTLWDLITLSCPDEGEEMWKQRDRFGAACVLLCQGTPFLHSGEEILRTKTSETNPDVKYGNSYNAGDYVNKISWESRTENKDVLEYYKGLIAFRKAHEGLRYQTEKELNRKLMSIEELPENVIGYYMSEPVNFFVENQICILLNPTSETVEYVPKSGTWKIYVDGERAGTECLKEISRGSSLDVEGVSALAAVRTKVRWERIALVTAGLMLVVAVLVIVRKGRHKKV